MPYYTVEAVLTKPDANGVWSNANDWPKDGPKYRPFELQLAGEGAPNTTVQLSRQLREGVVPENKIPKAKEQIFGELEENDYGWKLRPKSPPDGFTGSASNGSSGSGEDQYARRPEHPQNAARMARSKALELAPRYYELFRTENALASAGGDLQATKAKLVQISEWLEGLIDAAYEEPMPAPVTGPAPVSADDQVPF